MMQEEPVHVKNVARGHSKVNVQAGLVGNVIFGAAGGAGLQDQLAALRTELLAARDRHELDTETFAAADEELSKADELSADQSSAGRSRLVIALKRLKGLVDGIADLGSKIAAIIAVVHTLR